MSVRSPSRQSVFSVLWGTYIRNALIPIIFIELALIGAYLVTNYLVRDENIATMQLSAQQSLLETARLESEVIDTQLKGVAEMTNLFAELTSRAYDTPYIASEVEKGRYAFSETGVWHTRPETGEAAMFYSSITDIGDQEREKAWQMVQLDPLMAQLVNSSSLVAQAYLNTWDSMNRIYPAFDVVEQYPFDLDVTKYNFYYEADAKHNPDRGVVWTDVYIDPAGQGWMASAIAPVYRRGSDFMEGVVGLDIRVSEIVDHVLSLSLPWDGYALLVDGAGTILAMPNSAEDDWQLHELTDHEYSKAIEEDTFKPEEFNLFKRPDSLLVAQRLKADKTGVAELQLNGQLKLAAWAQIPGADWHLLVVVDQTRIYADANALKARVDQVAIGMILALLLFYLLFLAYLYRKSVRVGRRLSEPMVGLTRMIQSIGGGDYRPPSLATDITELHTLATGLSDMGSTLGRSREMLDDANRNLEKLNRQLEQRVEARTRELQLANTSLKQERQEQERLIAELKSTQAQLVQSEKMASVGVLAAGVAHEINNPLTFVGTNISILNDYVPALLRLHEQTVDLVAEEKREQLAAAEDEQRFPEIVDDMPDLLEDCSEGVRRIRHITESLLEFSHVGNTSWQTCDINHCIETTLVICYHEYKYKAEIKTDLEPNIPQIEAVPAQLNQVIMALVVNAAQAIERMGEITITSGSTGDKIFFTVSDTGCGIKPEVLDHIFEPFFTTKDVGQGTGLGLAVVYGIVKSHNGQILVESTPGKGSRFKVLLPIVQRKGN
ncbi:hypothetical protein KQ940_20405 [Marinobacterium sp. D7]|uniref:ATP-binding protein n=1 Tax=Marinobacterium ramblicola TaxID=2849041 RepID=UPI001C2DE0DD|nr:ATP-binding protein [Marinobacterium ramblicola]MBV1790427.1 hypothetical protein [Marinobacterium ramblicola]